MQSRLASRRSGSFFLSSLFLFCAAGDSMSLSLSSSTPLLFVCCARGSSITLVANRSTLLVALSKHSWRSSSSTKAKSFVRGSRYADISNSGDEPTCNVIQRSHRSLARYSLKRMTAGWIGRLLLVLLSASIFTHLLRIPAKMGEINPTVATFCRDSS